MTPKVDQNYKEARKQQIVEAACVSFAEKGFRDTTMKDIFKASGLSAGAVYNYFKSKEEIVEAMAAISSQRNMVMITGAVDESDSSPLSAILNRFFAIIKRVSESANAATSLSVDFDLWSEAARNERINQVARRCQEETLRHAAELVKREQGRGLINKKLDPVSVARALLAALQGLQVQLVLNPQLDLEAYFAVVEALVQGNFVPAMSKAKGR